MSLRKFIVDWLDLRLGVRDLVEQNLTRYLLPRNINIWYSLGAVLLTLFGLQFLTGFLLLIYYVPDTTQAFASVKHITNEVPYGWLIRNTHAVGSNLIVVVLLLHMLSALFMSAYKKPRELTWLFGFILFNLTLALCLTGYLLPWSQLSFWATTVATEAPGAIPVVGEHVVRFLRGGAMVGEATLGRFFALHVMGLPLLFALMLGLHLFCVRRAGISRPPFGRDYRPAPKRHSFEHEYHPGGIPFFPNYAVKEGAVVCFFLALLAVLVFFAPNLFIPPAAFEPANPFVTPERIKPEWYFLWAYQTLKIFPSEAMGLAVQGAAMTFLALLPFIDRFSERRPARRPLFVGCFVLGILLFIGLSLWGHWS
ncbi:cytochrome b [Geoalkalibacter halelectricus]|uniref:Cytochrome bc complex cytochrome b subunit n=1 Tax=Geoalkalibacter halelectricus TaxID=2847045 RepID=A0ABY5ZI67_9BACT|nr:cytochrome bc complex cytochrome b subunit [Geoalkalibacter halelectricus]MDO3380148.1 cytochrome bc complex cytochrome b subunit [Geoalkalibacter halelectricus]UWZ78278.1 cytochrome bc complex cytochrome b subunit [Geoalkalibacter halelectricus]